ncbi:MAG: nickel pincer cofactor biosynthesis protein LarC, partial [Calditrichia bacterium]
IHNQPIKKVHFHEIGAVDTIIDVVGALAGLKLLGIEKVFCSPINVGSGFIDFSHGRYPVPAPAAAELLKDVPIYSTDSGGELTTPTGAAIITEIAHGFGDMPEMKTERIGYGAGTKDFKQPNVLRVFIGEILQPTDLEMDLVSVIETNIDDMNPQIYDHLFDVLFSNGALDVFLSNIAMKKNRPAVKLTVLCDNADEKKFSGLIFRETSSIGVRIRQEKRYKLSREIQKIQTEYGEVKIKISKLRGEILSRVPEYEDCKRIAREKGIPLKMIYDAVLRSISSKP